MDPTLEEKQNEQPQQKQSKEGTISQGIRTINNLAQARRGFSNPLGKIGSRIAIQTGLRGLIASMGPALLPILITLVVVVAFTILIVGFGGAPPSETIIPTIEPTQTETPTPTPVP